MTSGDQIRDARTNAGLSARGLAEKIGISYAYLSEIETGKKPGSVKTLKAIADELGLDLGLLNTSGSEDPMEFDLIENFRELNAEDKSAVLRHASALRMAADMRRVIK